MPPKDLKRYVADLDEVAEPEPLAERPRAPLPPIRFKGPKDRPVAPPVPPNYRPATFAGLYLGVVLPVLGGAAVALAARTVFGMYELLCFAAAVAFAVWARVGRAVPAGAWTWRQAGRLAAQQTWRFGSVPLAACLAFVVTWWAADIFWAWAAAVTLAVAAYGLTASPPPPPPTEPTPKTTERGQQRGGILEKWWEIHNE